MPISLKYSRTDIGVAVVATLLKQQIESISLQIRPTVDANDQPEVTLLDGATISGAATVSQYLVQTAGGKPEWLGVTDVDKADVQQWLTYASTSLQTDLAGDEATVSAALKSMDEYLAGRTFYVGSSLTLADILIYGTIYYPVAKLQRADRLKYSNVTRFFDLAQHLVHELTDDVPTKLIAIDLEAPPEEKAVVVKKEKKADEAAPDAKKAKGGKGANGKENAGAPKAEEKQGGNAAITDAKSEGKPKASKDSGDTTEKKTDGKKADGKKADGKKVDGKKEKAAAPVKAESAGETLPDPSKLDLRVGYILSAERHPDAESLYVEQVDVGEEKPRTVVSGLVKYMKAEELANRYVVLLCNLKPAKMRGVESQAMVLAATSTDGLSVELVTPHSSSKPGDRAFFESHEAGKPDAVLTPKKKIWEGIQPGLKTDDQGRAMYVDPAGKTCLMKTEKGECAVKSVKGGSIR